MSVTVYVGGTSYCLRTDTLEIQDRVLERSTCVFSLLVENTVFLTQSQQVQVYNDTSLLFAGTVDEASYYDFPQSTKRNYSISCSDNHYLVDKRVVAKVFENITCGDAVKWIVDNILTEEGITYTSTSIEDGETLSKKSYNYRNANLVMDDLADRSNFIWYVDKNKVIYFKQLIAGTTSAVVDYTNMLEQGYNVESERELYRNVQYILGGRSQTDLISYEIDYNEIWEEITLKYPLAEIPSIYVNDSLQVIALKSSDDADTTAFIYSLEDAVIGYNVDTALLSSGDTVRVEYYGSYKVVGNVQDNNKISALATKDGSSGKVEHLIVDEAIRSIDDLQATGQAKIDRYGQDNYSVTFETYTEPTYSTGDTVRALLTQDNIDESMLVESIITVDDYDTLKYVISLVFGNTHETYVRFFTRVLDTGYIATDDETENEIIITSYEYDKTFTSTTSPYPFNDLICGDGTICGSSTVVMFSNTNFYIELRDSTDTLIERVEYTKFTAFNILADDRNIWGTTQFGDTFTDKYTRKYTVLHIITELEGIGTWNYLKFYGGADATSSEGTGSLLHTETVSISKTDLDTVYVTFNMIED